MSAPIDLALEKTPLCIVDLETTGLSPGLDRIVEVTVIRMDPGEEPRLALDTLVFPERRVAATEIHGISDQDVAGAPTFAELMPEILEAMSGAVMVSYNVYFDIRFLAHELDCNDLELDLPHLCAMYMRPLLGIGKRCSLRTACTESGVEHVGIHSSAGNAIATSELMQYYLGLARSRGATTLRELAPGKRYKFMKSWSRQLVEFPAAPTEIPKKSRLLDEPEPSGEDRRRWRLREYQETVLAFLEDLDVSPDEVDYARSLREELQITQEEVRAVHARIFAATLNQWAGDDRIDDAEVQSLERLSRGLQLLGWRPG